MSEQSVAPATLSPVTAMAVQAQHPRISAEELLAQDHLIGSEVVDGVVHVEPRRSGTSGSAGTPTSPCGCGPPHQGRAAGPAGAATGSGPRQRRRARRLLGGAPTEGSRHDGPPDPAVDARSPTTWLPDIGRKRDVHRASDVGERWLVDAPADNPDEWLMVPTPRGPYGLGYMLVVAGLAIPRGAPDEAGPRAVVEALLAPETQVEVLRQNAFFPVVDVDLPADLPPAIRLEAEAVRAQQEDPDALVSVPPVGLGERDGEVSQIFKDCFQEICLDGQPPAEVLERQGALLDEILADLHVPCWQPDPPSDHCQVG